MIDAEFTKIANQIHKENFSKWEEIKDTEYSEHIRKNFKNYTFEKIIADITNLIRNDDLKRKLLKEYSKFIENEKNYAIEMAERSRNSLITAVKSYEELKKSWKLLVISNIVSILTSIYLLTF